MGQPLDVMHPATRIPLLARPSVCRDARRTLPSWSLVNSLVQRRKGLSKQEKRGAGRQAGGAVRRGPERDGPVEERWRPPVSVVARRKRAERVNTYNKDGRRRRQRRALDRRAVGPSASAQRVNGSLSWPSGAEHGTAQDAVEQAVQPFRHPETRLVAAQR
jgi:hypothetical protein